MPIRTEARRVLLGVTGSIAAYKAAELVRLLTPWGYEVRVVMTEGAQQFITPLTMQAVSGNPVLTDFWTEGQGHGMGHIELADWADAVVVAPASADFLAKLRMGSAENPLLAICLATKAPLLVAPAMNVNMFEHVATQENILALKQRGVRFVEPEHGMLACGWRGTGRLAHPKEIFFHVRRTLAPNDLAGKRVLITTGPTREPVDPVRFITNRSSGKMGVALAREAFRRGAEVTLVHGPIKVSVPTPVRTIEVETAQQMHNVVLTHAFPLEGGEPAPDIVIMAAAVADYRPAESSLHKLKKSEGIPRIELVPNVDILAALGARRRAEGAGPLLVGFAVETGELPELLDEVRRKMERKGADMIVGNLAHEAFELNTNRVWIVDRNGSQREVATTHKSRVANKILDAVLKL